MLEDAAQGRALRVFYDAKFDRYLFNVVSEVNRERHRSLLLISHGSRVLELLFWRLSRHLLFNTVILHFLRDEHLGVELSLAVLAYLAYHGVLVVEKVLLDVSVKQVLVRGVQVLSAMLEELAARAARVEDCLRYGAVSRLRRGHNCLVLRVLQRYPLVVCSN